MAESVQVSFESQSDIFPGARTKYIHSVGAVAPIKWESLTSKYGGLFASGSEHGFASPQPQSQAALVSLLALA